MLAATGLCAAQAREIAADHGGSPTDALARRLMPGPGGGGSRLLAGAAVRHLAVRHRPAARSSLSVAREARLFGRGWGDAPCCCVWVLDCPCAL